MALNKFTEQPLEFTNLQAYFQHLHEYRNSRLNIVAIGATGGGKTSTINTLIEHASDVKPTKFHSEESPLSVTKKFQECKINLFGLNCRLIDTVGLFDTNLTQRNKQLQFTNTDKHNNVLSNLAEVISLCTDGVDAFLFVVDSTMRAIELPETIEVIQKFFGTSVFDHCIFILTKNDVAKPGTIDKYKDVIKKQLSSNNYNGIDDRFVPFDNENRKEYQVIQLLKMIEENIMARDGCPYSNVVFQKAQEILEEEKANLQVELNAEYQRQIAERVKEISEANEIQLKTVKDDLEKKYNDLANAKQEELKRSNEEIQKLLDKQLQLEKENEIATKRVKENEKLRLQEEIIRKQNATIERLKTEWKKSQNSIGTARGNTRPSQSSSENSQGAATSSVWNYVPSLNTVVDAVRAVSEAAVVYNGIANQQGTSSNFGSARQGQFGSDTTERDPLPPYPNSDYLVRSTTQMYQSRSGSGPGSGAQPTSSNRGYPGNNPVRTIPYSGFPESFPPMLTNPNCKFPESQPPMLTNPNQGYSSQRYPNQGYPNQRYPNQVYPNQGYVGNGSSSRSHDPPSK